jgi:predicted Zn-dependent peptidase
MPRFSILSTVSLAAAFIGAAFSPAPAKSANSVKPAASSKAPAFDGVSPYAPGYPYGLTKPGSLKFKDYTFNPPEPRRVALPNGLIIYLLEDHELPVFNLIAYTKVGSIYVPEDKAGLSSLTGSVMRTGGTESQTGDQIDQALEYVGASVESGISQEYGSVSGTSLIKDSDLVIKTVNDILRHPAFAEDKLELARGQVIEGIRRQNDDPNQIAGREFRRLVYGRDSPWARVPTMTSVRSITRQDLVNFHHRYFHPNNTLIALSGDFKADAMMAKLRSTFGNWEKAAIEYPKLAPVKDVPKTQVFTVARDLPQTVVYMGHVGMHRDPIEKPTVDVLNEILGGGGFTSRLMREVRSNQGLAYSVVGVLTPGADRGLFFSYAQTRTESAMQAATVMRRIIGEMVTKPVTEEEVRLAKDSILNSYVFQYDSPYAIVSQRAYYELLGYPDGYMKRYPELIRKVTPAAVKAAAAKYLHPDRMVYLVVGKTEGVKPAVSTLGPVSALQLDPIEDIAPGPNDATSKAP